MKKLSFAIMVSALFFLLLTVSVSAKVRTELVEYKQGNTILEGYLAYDDEIPYKRPGVLVIHEWTGLNDYTKRRAEQLAQLGYVAFAADIYGKGVRPQNPQEAGKTASIYRNDLNLLRQRAQAGLDVLKKHSLLDSGKVAAIK